MNTSHENIYYIDPWFMAREYEARRNKPMPSKVTRSSQTGGNVSLGFAKGGVQSQETLAFDHSPESTFWDISPELNEIEEVKIESGMVLPSLFWVSGLFAPLGTTHKRQDEVVDESWVFSISHKHTYIRLVAEDAFFRFNIHNLLQHPETLGDTFRPFVRALLKGFRSVGDDDFLIAAPLVIIEDNS